MESELDYFLTNQTSSDDYHLGVEEVDWVSTEPVEGQNQERKACGFPALYAVSIPLISEYRE